MKCKGKSYLAPEVVSERLYGVASDIFSLGRMLKAISSLFGFMKGSENWLKCQPEISRQRDLAFMLLGVVFSKSADLISDRIASLHKISPSDWLTRRVV